MANVPWSLESGGAPLVKEENKTNVCLNALPHGGVIIIVVIYIHTHIYTYIHTHIHTYIHTYILAYIHIYKHAYIHTYMHTYIHTLSNAYMYNLHHHKQQHMYIKSKIAVA